MAQIATIYGAPYTVQNHIWFKRPYMVIFAKPYMVPICRHDHIWFPHMVRQNHIWFHEMDHIWSITHIRETIYGLPHMVTYTTYECPYMVKTYPHMVNHIRHVHIWAPIYGKNLSIYDHTCYTTTYDSHIWLPRQLIYGHPYMVTHVWFYVIYI